ncbi:MAG: protein-disulfide reductase DsbD [Gammaproteobacteria bacterium]|nr:protein-disulfide reductase DsbD [Gammaproteobacteria bacterium]
MKQIVFALTLITGIFTALISHNALAAPLAISALGSFDLGLNSGEDDILAPDQAFKLSTEVAGNKLLASWEIADGHYLYRDKFKLSLIDANGVESGTLDIAAGEMKNDEFFGKIYVFHHTAKASLAFSNNTGSSQKATFKVRYQGCSELSGICYPPITKKIPLVLPVTDANASTENNTSGTSSAASDNKDAYVSEQDRIASTLSSGSTWLILISFFGFGLLLAFTPCVFPMIPILSSIIIGHGKQITTRKAFSMSTVYVLAMALTYTAAGVFAGMFGENLQAAFQNPWILSSFAVVFVALSFSMFGFYDLQLPSSWQSKLSAISNNQKGGTLSGVAVMGFLSALIVGPCVAAPLAGALIYIGQTGDAVLGGLALFALSMGMGAPLIAIGTSAGKLLPRAGAWMDAVKAVFGVMLLAVAIWMLERILPAAFSMTLWALLLIISAIYMGALEALEHGISGWRRLWKGVGIFLLTYGVVILIGVASGGNDVLQPLKGVAFASAKNAPQAAHLDFKQIKGLDGLNAALAEAKAQGKPVMLDFYADWCVSCKEMEKLTFVDSDVQKKLAGFVLLQADVTPNDEKDQSLYDHFKIIGPPAIVFYDAQGNERRNLRVVGYMPAAEFASIIGRV